MPDAAHLYCDVSLPVPLDRPFTYQLPLTLRHRAQVGARVLVPFGSRKLTGVILRVHSEHSQEQMREVFGLLDEEPVLDAGLLKLACWIAEYYCAPLGEVLRSMLPLGGELRKSKVYSLTEAGQEIVKRLPVSDKADASVQILQLLESRPRSVAQLTKKFSQAKRTLASLEKRGWVTAEDQQESKDPLRAAASRLQVEFLQRLLETDSSIKLKKGERELLAFLELHPGSHNLAGLAETVKNASESARSLARKQLVRLEAETPHLLSEAAKPIPLLNEHQQVVFDVIRGALEAKSFASFLLQGVTGSGKTEVYLRSIEAVLALGRNALLLVPEIALTPAVAGQFFHRFGDQVAILHSAFGDAERAEQWRRIQNGAARVVVGTRSGVFAPVQNLGLIIVDEEHDGSYKQQENPRYHGRDVAVVRAKQLGACVVLGSATPSLESRYNAERGKYQLLLMPERVGKRPMPEVAIIDLREEFLETRQQATFSRKLLEQLQQRLEQGEQAMLLMNRRGFSSFVTCRSCGERVQCVNCAVTLTFHRRERRLLCHYCNYAEPVPNTCPKCGSEYIQFLGTGSERVEDELHTHLPTARIARLDRDTVGGKRHFEHILAAFRAGEIDMLVGTQMIAKGHDVPNVTLVGVVLADIGLAMPDFRAAERSFQLLTQAAGRAGRGTVPGKVLIQTLNPDHYAIRFAAAQDYEAFYQKEIQFRKWLRYPPFAGLANVLVRAEKKEEAMRLSAELGHLLNPSPEGIRVLGPAEAPVPRLKNEYRYQVLLKAAKRETLRETLQRIRQYALAEKWKATALVIDVDPLTLM